MHNRAPRRHRLTMLAATMISMIASSMSGAVALAASAPDTVIDTKPASPSNVTGATFTFHSTKSGSTFSCRLDGGTYAACPSPKAYTSLAQGTHTFSVYATWHGTPDPSPASYTWSIDTTLPSVPTNLTGSAPTPTAATLNWTASTDNGTLAGYHVYRDGSLLATLGLVTTYSDSTVVAGATYAYTLDARDAAGNNSAQTAGIQVSVPIPPQTTMDSAPSGGTTSTSAAFTFHADISGSTFTCKLDAAAATACSSPQSYSGLTEAQHTFSVYATVNGLDDPSPATATWTVDLTPPNAPTNLSATLTTLTTAQLTWTATADAGGIAGYNIFRDGALLTTTVGTGTSYTDTTVTSGATPAYALQAMDVAGNLSPLTPPVTAIQPLNSALTRMPYLTDVVGLKALVNFATDTSGSTATVKFGTSSGSSCSLTSTTTASKISIIVGAVTEYQWKAALTLPSAGTYCYRPFLGTNDLLGGNPSPTLQTQVPLGSSEDLTFDVFGDWGQVDVNGQNANQANLMHQIALSGARFAITTGDQGYPDGSQGTYGDIKQVGSNLSGIFGTPFWASLGSSLPIFATIGNHGFARSDAVHPQFANWPADVAVATSGGRAQVDAYPSVNGTNPASYPSAWYAFSAGTARFYLLTAAWADLNVGASTAYGDDYASHWTPTSPEYLWLQADLAAHPSELKFAFLHYPFYSDQDTETSDTFLQGDGSLEGLLASSGVALAFSGHAHIYERNAAPTGRLGLVSYVTGGGGADAESTVSVCNAIDRYAVGWSDTKGKGTACGSAPVPTSRAQIFHFLKVTISGSTITVTPTDSTGQTFDIQSYSFGQTPDTYIDSGPPAGTSITSADFTFHATSPSATFTCTLDAAAASCVSPKSYVGLLDGSHTFSVYATVNGVDDPLPATWTWTVDTTNPGPPGNFSASATSASSVLLGWSAASDNLSVTGYEIWRSGLLLATIAPATGYTDNAVVGGTNYDYKVRALDVAGNTSTFTPTITVTTPSAPAPVWADGFESGNLSAWTSSSGLTVQGSPVNSGSFAARGVTAAAGPYAKKTLPSTYVDGYARAWFLVQSQTSQLNLLRLRDAAAVSIGYAYLSPSGQVGFHNDASNTNTVSSTVAGPGWHALELHILTGGAGGAVGVWLDNVQIAALSGPVATSANPIGQIQVGETQTTGQVYDVVYDDAAFGTARLGPVPDAAPSKPTNLAATAISASEIDLTWTASTDDLGIAGYDILRGGSLIASVGNVTAFADTSVLASTTYTYTVKARDTSGNRSVPSDPASATTPGSTVAIFSDGFETGNLSNWTSSAGLGVENSNVNSGTYAAEASTAAGATYAKKLLPSTYTSGYLRAYVKIVSTSSQVNLFRFRTAADGSIGYLFVTSGGKLGLRADPAAITLSSTTPFSFGAWHSLEVHFTINGASGSTEVWLDGALVATLSTTVNIGTTAIGKVQIGEVNASGTWDVVYDDVAFNTSRVGP